MSDKEQNTTKDEVEAAREELNKLMAEPLGRAEADRIIAENAIHRSQLRAYRLSVEAKIADLSKHIVEIDSQLNAIDGEDALARRRVLNEAE